MTTATRLIIDFHGENDNGREPKSCLGRVFYFKLDCFGNECNSIAWTTTATSRPFTIKILTAVIVAVLQ
jgi:hypothetical protein